MSTTVPALPHNFDRFVAIDWSGAKGRRHRSIALAECRPDDAPPKLVRPGHAWAREEVLDWIGRATVEERLLIGFDFSFAAPFFDRGAYLPGDCTASAARDLWAFVDRHSTDDDLGAASFLEERFRRHFYFGIADGRKADYLRWRRCEQSLNAAGGRKLSTVFDAIGASQVAKGSFSGMRLLHRLPASIAVWPFDEPAGRSIVVEIYTRLFILKAGLNGQKIRSTAQLNEGLRNIGSRPVRPRRALSDHETDVLISAAGLRALAPNPAAWAPEGLTPEIARTEGWTFGVGSG